MCEKEFMMTTRQYSTLLLERKKMQEAALAQTLWELHTLSIVPNPYMSCTCINCGNGNVVIQSYAGPMHIKEAR